MKIHDYQAKAILARHGVPVPQGEVVFNSADARAAAGRLGGGTVVVCVGAVVLIARPRMLSGGQGLGWR